MDPQTAQLIVKVGTYYAVFIAAMSFIHSAMPPVSQFDGFPRIQNGYKILVLFVGVLAVNWRAQQQNEKSIPIGVGLINAVPTTETPKEGK